MSVNIGRLKQVRDFIATLPDKACEMTSWQNIAYDESDENGARKVTFAIMKESGFECGSAACIAGWTEIMVNKETREEASGRGALMEYVRATNWLNLDLIEHEDLFLSFPERPDTGWKAWMLARLDTCIEAGRIVQLTIAEGGGISEDDDDDETETNE